MKKNRDRIKLEKIIKEELNNVLQENAIQSQSFFVIMNADGLFRAKGPLRGDGLTKGGGPGWKKTESRVFASEQEAKDFLANEYKPHGQELQDFGWAPRELDPRKEQYVGASIVEFKSVRITPLSPKFMDMDKFDTMNKKAGEKMWAKKADARREREKAKLQKRLKDLG